MNTVTDKIRAEIAAHGVISFARFMELALYCPDCGFYEKKKDTVGQRGDFYTSVSVGPLFGQLLAFQFAEWLEKEVRSQKSEVRIVEGGAHDGQLAKDIFNWLKLHRPALFERIEYWIIEPSSVRQAWQKQTLTEFHQKIRWHESPITNHKSPISGIIFSNELLDAFPVYRIGWDAQRRVWFEWGVGYDEGKFVWKRVEHNIQHSTFNIQLSSKLLAALPDGFTTEVCPAAKQWWHGAGRLLQRGKLLTFDYGLEAQDFFSPQRTNGTLRAYRQHRLVADLLANPGEQDLTAHVNFTAIQQAGEVAGLKTELNGTQAQFLTRVAERAWKNESEFGPWTKAHTRQFQTLTHPNHLGCTFRVLIQSAGLFEVSS